MKNSKLTQAQAKLKLAILDKQAETKNKWEFYSEMRGLGLPDEIIGILEKILKVTSNIAGKAICIGKIIVMQLLDYVAMHPLQVAGLALGLGATYTLGVALGGLFASISSVSHLPHIGPLLGKLAVAVHNICRTIFVPAMILSPVVGCVAGEVFDKSYQEVNESLQRVAKDFFELFSQILNSIWNEINFDNLKESFS